MATHCRCNIVSSQLYLLLFHNYGKSNNVFLSCYKMFLLLRCEWETLDLLFKHDVTLTCTSHIHSITDQSHLPSHWQSSVKAFQVHEMYLIVQRCNKKPQGVDPAAWGISCSPEGSRHQRRTTGLRSALGLVFCCAGCYALICSCSTQSWSSSACRHAVYIVLVFSNEWNLNLLHESLVCFEPVSCNPAALDVSIVTSLLASACLWLLANCWEPVDHSCLEALTQTVLLSRWFMCGGGKDTCTANKSEMNTTWTFGNPRCVSHISG